MQHQNGSGSEKGIELFQLTAAHSLLVKAKHRRTHLGCRATATLNVSVNITIKKQAMNVVAQDIIQATPREEIVMVTEI